MRIAPIEYALLWIISHVWDAAVFVVLWELLN